MFLQHWVDKKVAAVLGDGHARTWLRPNVELATLRPVLGQFVASKQWQQWQEQQQQQQGQNQQQQWSAQPACLLDVLLAELELLVNPGGLTAGAPEVDYRWAGSAVDWPCCVLTSAGDVFDLLWQLHSGCWCTLV